MPAPLLYQLKIKMHNLKTSLYHLLKLDAFIIKQFHKFYYGAPAWRNTTWLGVLTLKCPLDLWVYQEIIFSQKPDYIIECGTARGGSALYLASMCDLVGSGRIITIDIDNGPQRPSHSRITYLHGSSTAQEIIAQVKQLIGDHKKVLVILDSDHRKDHVLKELQQYSPLINKDSYIIVEDSNINGHPVYRSFGHGPMEAIDAFLQENNNFIIDAEKEKFYLTFNPRGFLKRI